MVGSPLARIEPHAYTLLRIVSGFMFALHGLQKFGLLGGDRVSLASLLGVAGLIEVVSGILIMIGLATVPAAFLASGEMAYAYFFAHMPGGFLPVLNRGEPAALYAVIFLFIAARGSGRLSLDERMG